MSAWTLVPRKFRHNYSLGLHFCQQKRCLFLICGCLLMLFLLYDSYSRNSLVRVWANPAYISSVRIHVSDVWVIKDNKHFSDEDYDSLLTSSLRTQHFDPSPQKPADSASTSHWKVIIEGKDDYFTSAENYSDSETIYQRERHTTCQLPIKNVLFLKTHYTGSEVVTNIFNRFADFRELLVALPTNGLSSFYWPSKFHWRYMDMKRLQGNLPNVLCNHARYNAEVMEKFMPFNTRYVSMIRNPIDHFVTVFKELRISARMAIDSTNPLETFVVNAKRYLKEAIQQKRFFDSMNLLKNGMFFDLGLHTSEYDQEIAVTSAIFDLQKTFSLILIHEYLDESLVLMKRKFCWDTDDVIYLSSYFPRATAPAQVISSRTKEAIANWNKADWMLYEIFNATLWESIQNEKDFYPELEAFKARRKELELYCLETNSEKTPTKFALVELSLNDSVVSQAKRICEKMAMTEGDYLEYFRRKY